jgi:antitoxin component YwqK of YwqJK toxin-antitoxin module
MNQKERLAICSSCTHRKIDFELGYVCQLTGSFADFKETCKNYEPDESVTDTIRIRTKPRPMVPLFDPVPEPAETEKTKKAAEKKRPSEVALKKLRKYQSFPYAMIGGLLFTGISSVGCAFFTATTGIQGVYMVLGVGLLVGMAVRFFGAGINRIFGILAVLLTLAGSLLGCYLSRTDFPEEMQLASIIKVPDYLSPDLMLHTMRDTFVPLDLVFYGLAALLGYLLAIRRINKRKMARLERDGYKGAPALYWLRLPLILALILLPAYYGYTLTNQDTGGYDTLYYESGKKMSEGRMLNGLETGEWTSWHENGNIKSTGYYTDGQKDSLWKWYDESGFLTATGTYRHGVENGTWMHYYPDGVVSDSGAYLDGLKEGLWKYYHEIGSLRSAVNYRAGKMHGEKILLSSSGKIVKVAYFENGMLVEKEQ